MNHGQSPKILVGDIVSFEFPFSEGAQAYARPSLVLDATEDELLLAYCTTSDRDANGGYEIRLRHEFRACGLDRPSRFVLTRRLRVTKSDARLQCQRTTGSPVIGALTAEPLARAQMLYAHIASTWSDQGRRVDAERQGLNPPRGIRRRNAAARHEV